MPSKKSWQIWHPPKTLAKEVWERLQIEYDACCNVMGQCSLHKLKLDCELILLPCSPTSKVIVKRCPEPKPVISISMWLCSGAMVTLESLQQYMFKILFTLSKETGNPAFILSISNLIQPFQSSKEINSCRGKHFPLLIKNFLTKSEG